MKFRYLYIIILILSLVSISNAAVTKYTTTVDNYTVIIFNGSGSTTWNTPDNVTQVEYLVIGGGGGSGGYLGGGGGAGGFRNGTRYLVNGTLNVVVGAGGSQANGENSSFGNISATGGGTGAIGGGDSSTPHANPGGSGGGGGSTNGHLSGASGNLGGYTPVEGYAGGNSPGQSGNYPSAGGGGAGGVGGSPATTTSVGANGGIGLQSNITGVLTYYAGGGGGSGTLGAGTGGLGGGGNAGAFNGVGAWVSAASNGTDGLGGGAGGGWLKTPPGYAKGGDGVVIIKYSSVSPIANFSADIVEGSAPLTVHFTDISEYAPTSWNWTFESGQYSSLQNPTYIYRKSGLYTVTLNVTNSLGNNITTKVAYINATTHINDTWYYFDDGHYEKTNGSYTIAKYNRTGTYNWTSLSPIISDVEYLIVAGGGSGHAFSTNGAAGGGAGGFVNGTNYSIAVGGIYNITVGIGGSAGAQGENSSFNGVVANGGGSAGGIGGDGGSGGGGGNFGTSGTYAGGNGTPGQGYNGGSGTGNAGYGGGGGGGGAGGNGLNGSGGGGANGGIGKNSSITGENITYAGGGGGSAGYYGGTQGVGGLGGGGNAGSTGTNELGGGGGAGTSGTTIHSGGSGIVILKYFTVDPPPSTNFTSDVIEGSSPLTVHFTDTTTDGPVTWNWSFEGSNFSESTNPIYVFRDVGLYTITLNTSNMYGYNISTKVNYINVTANIPDVWYYVNDTHYEKTNGSYVVAKYNKTGNYTWTNPTNNTINVEYLIIAGGGSGHAYSTNGAAGGGAGGFVNGTASSMVVGAVYNITVGVGGAAGTQGGNSSFNGVIANGGGAAGGIGGDGGSGGGGGNFGTSGTYAGGNGTPGQGYNGGSGTGNSGDGAGGGGGGANSTGVNGYAASGSSIGGDGGSGKNSSITFEEITYAGGGAGSVGFKGGSRQGIGGIGGGGNAGSAGTNELGGGGGAGTSGETIYSGGSGIVILKYNYTPSGEPTPGVPQSIENLTYVIGNYSSGYGNMITWLWNNPDDVNFTGISVWQNNTFLYNMTSGETSDEWYDLPQNTSYTISTKTFNSIGGMNGTWINSTATTPPNTTPIPTPTPTVTSTPHRTTVEDKMNDVQGFIVIGIYLMIGTVIIALIGKVVLDSGN